MFGISLGYPSIKAMSLYSKKKDLYMPIFTIFVITLSIF